MWYNENNLKNLDKHLQNEDFVRKHKPRRTLKRKQREAKLARDIARGITPRKKGRGYRDNHH